LSSTQLLPQTVPSANQDNLGHADGHVLLNLNLENKNWFDCSNNISRHVACAYTRDDDALSSNGAMNDDHHNNDAHDDHACNGIYHVDSTRYNSDRRDNDGQSNNGHADDAFCVFYASYTYRVYHGSGGHV